MRLKSALQVAKLLKQIFIVTVSVLSSNNCMGALCLSEIRVGMLIKEHHV